MSLPTLRTFSEPELNQRRARPSIGNRADQQWLTRLNSPIVMRVSQILGAGLCSAEDGMARLRAWA